MNETEELKRKMAEIQYELTILSKSNILKESEAVERNEKLAELKAEYIETKNRLKRIIREERKEENAKRKK